jgi:DNA-binding MurR/RpiR family transcriptional regulator
MMEEAKATSFDELRNRIAEARETMPKRLVQAAGYVLAHPDDTALGTAASIAKSADVQPSTLVRLAHHLGYEGFSDLQTVFRDRLKMRASTYEERLHNLESANDPAAIEATLLSGFISAARRSIEGLEANLDPGRFTQATEVLAGAGTIYLIARRRSFPLTAQMAYAFAKLGIRNVMVNSAIGISDEILAQAAPGDAAIVCSFSPYAPETIAQANHLAEKKIPFVAITDSAMSPLCKDASVWLEVSETDFAGFRSISASMAVAAALPVSVAERRRKNS